MPLSIIMGLTQKIGIGLLIIGLILLHLILMGTSYRLTSKGVEKHIPDALKSTSFCHEASDLLEQPVRSSITLVKAIHAICNRINNKQQQHYGIQSSDIERIIKEKWSANQAFTFHNVEAVLEGDMATRTFKKEALSQYGSWLEGYVYASSSSLKKDLENVASNIARYEIKSRFGFDSYHIKTLTYVLAKEANRGTVREHPSLWLFIILFCCVGGAFMYILPQLGKSASVVNHGTFFSPMKTLQWLSVLTSIWLIMFYVVLYFFPEYMTPWVTMVDPLSMLLSGNEAGRFFLYGFMYTLCILIFGLRMLIRYRHSRYQTMRTFSVMFFQTAFAFIIPEILVLLNQPYFDFKNIWPLDYDFFFDVEIDKMIAHGTIGIFMLGWGIGLTLIGVPVLVYFFGKRWYCSWVCGCGGLAETLGDSFRHRSDKSLKAWQWERWMIHGVLVFAVLMTVATLYTYVTNEPTFLYMDSYTLREIYGAWIGAGFAGVVGTGFYPLMGSRVWCRFGCPLAAYLGIVQRLKSRFRITTNGGQCISCGNCSTYCEMGIDVRWYAQRGQDIVRSSCVGCGICSEVCPRGVLNLENNKQKPNKLAKM